MPEKFSMRIAVNLILIRDGKALLLRRANTGWKDGEYSVVAGHVDGNETIASAMAREAKEEANLDIREEDLRVVHIQHRISSSVPGGVEHMDFNLVTDTWSGDLQNLEPDKCDDLSWHAIDALPDNTVGYIREVFKHLHNGVLFSEWREPNV